MKKIGLITIIIVFLAFIINVINYIDTGILEDGLFAYGFLSILSMFIILKYKKS